MDGSEAKEDSSEDSFHSEGQEDKYEKRNVSLQPNVEITSSLVLIRHRSQVDNLEPY